MRVSVLALLLVLFAPLASALVVAPGRHVIAPRAAASSVQMGPAKDGPFTPLVLAAKVRLHTTTSAHHYSSRQHHC